MDHGCTTLLSPTFDLTGATMAFVNYWRWYGEGGNSSDDEFAVDVSDDGGATWRTVERRRRQPEQLAAGGRRIWAR